MSHQATEDATRCQPMKICMNKTSTLITSGDSLEEPVEYADGNTGSSLRSLSPINCVAVPGKASLT